MASYPWLHRYDGNVIFASVVLGGLSWLQTWSTSDDCESNLHLRWFLLIYLLHWQGYLYFWRQHEYALSRNQHKDPFLLPETGYIVRSSLNTWILLFAVLSSLIYTYLFVQAAVNCKMFEFKVTVIYQWILVFSLLVFVFGMRKFFKRIKRTWKILSKIFTHSAKYGRLKTKMVVAMRDVHSMSGLKNYFMLSKSVDDFKNKNDWRSEVLLLYVPLLNLHEEEGQNANFLDLHFLRNRLTRLITIRDSKQPQRYCSICSESLIEMDRVISLSCCHNQSLVHWNCIRQRLTCNMACIICGNNSLASLKNTLFKLHLFSGDAVAKTPPSPNYEGLLTPLLG